MMIPDPTHVDSDFEYELKFAKFRYADLIKANPIYLQQLKEEFKQLEAKPKLQTYIRSFIPDDEYEAAMNERDSTYYTTTTKMAMRDVVSRSEMEKQVRVLMDEFQEKLLHKTLDSKFNGRLLSNTPMVQTISKLDKKLDAYRHYVFDDANIDNYQKYAVAAAKGILKSLVELKDIFLRQTLLREVLNVSIESDIILKIYIGSIKAEDQAKLVRNFNVLKTYADEVLFQAAEEMQMQIDRKMPAGPADPEGTLVDRVLRQLGIIDFVFRAQYFKYEGSSDEMRTAIQGPDGHSRIDGSYIAKMDILSNVELFNVQEFKQVVTTRFETAQNHQLLNVQLLDVHTAALKALNFYNTKLTRRNRIVAEFLKQQERPVQERIDDERYDALVVIDDYYVNYIVIGANRQSENSARIIQRGRKFWYFATNHILATICRQLLDFIEKIGVIKVVDVHNEFIDKPYRFFSYDLNNYRPLGDPDLTPEENVKESYRKQQLILETRFQHEFRKNGHHTLVDFLERQMELTPAPKEEFLNYVEWIASADLQHNFHNASIPKADVFYYWLKQKKELYMAQLAENTKSESLSAADFFKEPDYIKFINLLKESTPPMLNALGEYIGGHRKKGGVTAWVDALEKAGKIRSLTDSQKAEALKNMFPDFTITPRALRDTSTIHRNLEAFFTARINRL